MMFRTVTANNSFWLITYFGGRLCKFFNRLEISIEFCVLCYPNTVDLHVIFFTSLPRLENCRLNPSKMT
jgi:hypothetical protein